MTSCIFCKIIAKGEIPSTEVYEDDNVYAFLDNSPSSIGHTLVVPKKHYENLFDIPDAELGILGARVKKVARAVKDALKADGINISMNNGRAAGQVVFHAHIHIIPRFNDDIFSHGKERKQYRDGEMVEIASKIRKSF
ncbi:MAG: HIT family protein [bacterium]|nr:HIT family protein [bacterium]